MRPRKGLVLLLDDHREDRELITMTALDAQGAANPRAPQVGAALDAVVGASFPTLERGPAPTTSTGRPRRRLARVPRPAERRSHRPLPRVRDDRRRPGGRAFARRGSHQLPATPGGRRGDLQDVPARREEAPTAREPGSRPTSIRGSWGCSRLPRPPRGPSPTHGRSTPWARTGSRFSARGRTSARPSRTPGSPGGRRGRHQR